MEKKKKKFYAVVRGRKTGVFAKWFGDDCAEVQIRKFPGAIYKGFYTLKDAREWLLNQGSGKQQPVLETSQNKPEGSSTAGKVLIYTDGGCLNNPGPGGYGTVLLKGDHREELSSGFRLTTNNRMELMACIEGLKALKSKSSAVIHSDSRYVVNGITRGWAKKWRANNWKRNKTDRAENADLWAQLLDLCDRHSVEFVWIKGHAGNPENERCDQLASIAASREGLPPDSIYENMKNVGGHGT